MSPYYRLMITALLSKKTTMNFLSLKKNHLYSRKQQRFFKLPSRPRRNLSLQSHLTGLLGYFNRPLRQWKQLRRPHPRICPRPMAPLNLFSLPRPRLRHQLIPLSRSHHHPFNLLQSQHYSKTLPPQTYPSHHSHGRPLLKAHLRHL